MTTLLAAACGLACILVMFQAPEILTQLRAGLRFAGAPRRRWRCLSDLPEFFELLALCLSSGQTLARSWQTAVGHMPAGPLRQELERASVPLTAGRSPAAAMSHLSKSLGEATAGMALSLIAQAMVRGNAIEAVLLGQAAALRKLRMLEIERRAQTAPLRMMAPIFVLIFPAVLILLVAPVILRVSQMGTLF